MLIGAAVSNPMPNNNNWIPFVNCMPPPPPSGQNGPGSNGAGQPPNGPPPNGPTGTPPTGTPPTGTPNPSNMPLCPSPPPPTTMSSN